ncbi:MAG TPA: 2-dehydropantoate 2-reductase [Gaiella sp.]|nr:2-dehydropantoate 2-reductase [Gaiella sp.]
MTRAPLAVLGLGGVGGALAARTGALCVGTERTVEAIRERGLTLVHGAETTVVHPEATTRLEQPVPLLVVAVKAYDLDAALDRVDPDALDGAVVLPLLNGLEHVDAIRGLLDGIAVAAGTIGVFSAAATEPAVVVQATAGPATIRAASQDVDRETLAAALAPLEVPGVEVVLEDDERAVLWEKAVRLAVLAAATTASGLAVGALRGDPAWRVRMRAAVGEVTATAEADSVPMSAEAQWGMIEAMQPELTTSAARDAAAGRPTELDAIVGSIVRAAARLGVATPALEALWEEARCRAR